LGIISLRGYWIDVMLRRWKAHEQDDRGWDRRNQGLQQGGRFDK